MSDFDSFDKVVLSIVATTEHRVDGQRIVGLCSTLVVFRLSLCPMVFACQDIRVRGGAGMRGSMQGSLSF